MAAISNNLALHRLNQIRLLAMDVDGVLTDGGVYVLESGEQFRRFNIQDGLGLKRVMSAGLEVIWISSGSCTSAKHRANELGIENVFLGVVDKLPVLEDFCETHNIPLEQVAYIGDDLADLEVMENIGIAIATADAVDLVKKVSVIITGQKGGHGAVREVSDMLIEAIQRAGKNETTEAAPFPRCETGDL